MGSVDQRALKLLAVKFGVIKKKSAASAEVCASTFCQAQIQPGFIHFQSLTDSKFAVL